MEAVANPDNLKILQEKQEEVLKLVNAHFAYLEQQVKANKNVNLVVNQNRSNRLSVELTKYVSAYNPGSFIPIAPHTNNNVYTDITKTFGNTPLVRLNNLAVTQNLHGTVLLKLEFFNPLNSVKDRIGVQMFDDVFASGQVTTNTTFIEPTSGNTGIGLAFVAAARQLKLILILPEHLSDERKKMFKILGAKLVLTPKSGGIKAAIQKAHELNKLIPDSLILQQFENPSNPKVHRETTAEEIWSDTNGAVDYLVSGVGTGGTITGVGEVIKQRKNTFRVVAVEPKNSPVISGGKPGPHMIQGIGAGFIPFNLNTKIIDEIIQVEDKDAFDIMKRVNAQEGVGCGVSSGAIIWAAIQLAQREETKGQIIVAIVPSCTERYLSIDALKDQKLLQSDEDDIKKEWVK